jgi:hypothetical protein
MYMAAIDLLNAQNHFRIDRRKSLKFSGYYNYQPF